MSVSAISLRGLTVRFGTHTAVDGLDLEVRAGEVLGLLGANGAGKTTTIRALVTLLPPTRGTIAVHGHDVRREPMRARRLLGYVPQMVSVDGALTGWDNVMLFARLFDVPRRERRARVGAVLEAMGLTDAAGRSAAGYSGGMVRRLELAQALVSAPRVLVLDEPTVGLDPVARDDVWRHVLAMRDRSGMTVLLTTHYMEEAGALCDRIALMSHGRLRRLGTPDELKADLRPDATLDDVFRHHAGARLGATSPRAIDHVGSARSTARRLG
jgi:ABC-2 type transport system ATP-binding protein